MRASVSFVVHVDGMLGGSAGSEAPSLERGKDRKGGRKGGRAAIKKCLISVQRYVALSAKRNFHKSDRWALPWLNVFVFKR